MVLSRRALARTALPVATLADATFLQLGILSAEPADFSVRLELCSMGVALVFDTVIATLNHPESLAHRIGEPYGSLILTLAVTIIEVSVIVVLLLTVDNNPTLAR